MQGTLYVIGTPLGNLGDITLRAIETLEKVEVLFCEDSRVTSRLINHLLERNLISKKPRYVPYNEFNEDQVFPQIIQMMQDGTIVGLVSDAGMPAISDPGYRAIRASLDAGLRVQVIPGPTAVTTALPFSGIGGEIALYLGFLPKTSGKAERILQSAKTLLLSEPSTRIVVYVSPHRLVKDLVHIQAVMGDIHCVLLRELTKRYEERVEGTVEGIMHKYTNVKIRGELVLVLSQERAAGHGAGLVDTHNFEDGRSDVTQNAPPNRASLA